MGKTFNFKESMNMVSAVSGSYVTRREVMEYFYGKFDQDKEFSPEELKQAVRDLTAGKEKITTRLDQGALWDKGRRPKQQKEQEER